MLHNGVLVQDAVEIWGPTGWLQHQPYSPHPDKLPLSLQDHGNPVRYRNIWVRELRESDAPGPVPTNEPPVIHLPISVLRKYAGKYVREPSSECRILFDNDRLRIDFFGPVSPELVPHSLTEFSMRWTAGKVIFDLDKNGNPRAFTFHLGGKEYTAKKVTEPKKAKK